MSKDKSQYKKLGVDSDKGDVRDVFSRLIDNDYPDAFVNIISNPIDDNYVLTQHSDGDGSKSVQRFLDYFVNKDRAIFRGIVDDGLTMNLGDIAASGFVFGPIIMTDTLNVGLISKGVKRIIMEQIARRIIALKEIYKDYGFNTIKFLGGETADLPDQVKSSVFDMTVTALALRGDVITGNVRPGDKIYGFASDGQAEWEEVPNSGIMANGLTLGRSCLMSSEYNKLTHLKRDDDFYTGKYDINDTPDILKGMTVSEAILSPARQWAIVIRKIIQKLKKVNAQDLLHGISMNTGGGATKIKHVGGQKPVHYSKMMPTPPPIFQLIQQESGETWENMYRTFNCGIGIDVVGKDDSVFHEAIKEASAECEVGVHELGFCFSADSEEKENKIILKTDFGTFSY